MAKMKGEWEHVSDGGDGGYDGSVMVVKVVVTIVVVVTKSKKSKLNNGSWSKYDWKFYLSWGNYNERDLCVRSEISLMGGWICGGRLLWKRFLLWPFSALPLLPPPAIEPFSFRISTLTLSVSCDDHSAKTLVSVHPT